jgi:hypothetical protein
MGSSYVATEPSKKSADGHRKRASDKAKSADKLRENLRDHQTAVNAFIQAQAAVEIALAERAARMKVADDEPSDDDDRHRRRRTNQEPRESKGKGKRREDRSRSRGGNQGSSRR